MQVHVVFTAQGSNTALGNFAPGDRLRCSEAMARHLVEEARVARYATAAPPPAALPPQEPPAPTAGAGAPKRPRARRTRAEPTATQ